MTCVITPAFQATLDKNKDRFAQCMAIDGEVYRALENRRTVRFSRDNKVYFIKQHFGIGYREIFKNLLRGRLPITGAKNEWRALAHLQKHGVPAPDVVAYGERGYNPATRQSFIVMKAFTHKISLYDFLQLPQCDASFRQRLIQSIGDFTRKLHQLGVHHRDYYLVHLCLDTKALEKNKIELFVYDLHRASLHKKIPTRLLIKDLASLYFAAQSSVQDLSLADVRLFLENYFAAPYEKILETQSNLLHKLEKKALKIYAREHAGKKFTPLFDAP